MTALEGSIHRRALIILWLLIALYVVNFSFLSLLQNAAFETGAADLGNMNQAAWYTLHMGYPADSFAGQVITRFGGHVEPIFYLLALPYALGQNANTLLILQTVAIALGAIAAYLLGRSVLKLESAGLAFALVYLLFPSLQAANLTEFHPVALAAPLFLFAFYYLQKGSYLPFFLFALLGMSTKEDMSLLVVMLGLCAVLQALVFARPGTPRQTNEQRRRLLAGLLAIGAGLAWFLVTVYVIIPHFSRSGEVVLFQRYAEVGGSPQGLLGTMLHDPLSVVARVLAPEKLSYLAGLLASAGGLTIFAPWLLLLAAPSLGINMLSNYSPMYSGLSHYSAPVAPFVVIGAIYGARNLSNLLERRLHWDTRRSLLLVLGWLLACATLYQAAVGFTPLSIHYRVPVVTSHDQMIARFALQIPADAVVSAQTPLHPHLSSRALIYDFPMVNDASYILLDVTARPTMHPNDLKNEVERLLSQEGFGILDAADGYILLQKGAANKDLPDGFYSAFRSSAPQPSHRVVVDFGPSLRLLGYDIEDVDEGRQPWTRTRLYWQVRGPLPAGLQIYPYYLDDQGKVIEDTTQRPPVAPLWYPPERWQTGETIVIQTLPWPLPDHVRLAVGVVQGSNWANRATRLPAQLVQGNVAVQPRDGASAVELGRFERQTTGLALRPLPAPKPSVRLQATLGKEIRLLGYDMPSEAFFRPGLTLDVTLYWQSLARSPLDYHTFAHLLDSRGVVVAQSDGVTGNERPTSWWQPGQVITETRSIVIPDATFVVPSLAVGIYRLDTQERLPVTGSGGKSLGDTITIIINPSP